MVRSFKTETSAYYPSGCYQYGVETGSSIYYNKNSQSRSQCSKHNVFRCFCNPWYYSEEPDPISLECTHLGPTGISVQIIYLPLYVFALFLTVSALTRSFIQCRETGCKAGGRRKVINPFIQVAVASILRNRRSSPDDGTPLQ